MNKKFVNKLKKYRVGCFEIPSKETVEPETFNGNDFKDEKFIFKEELILEEYAFHNAVLKEVDIQELESAKENAFSWTNMQKLNIVGQGSPTTLEEYAIDRCNIQELNISNINELDHSSIHFIYSDKVNIEKIGKMNLYAIENSCIKELSLKNIKIIDTHAISTEGILNTLVLENINKINSGNFNNIKIKNLYIKNCENIDENVFVNADIDSITFIGTKEKYNTFIKLPNIDITTMKINFIEEDASLDDLISAGKSFKEINKMYKDIEQR